LERREVPRLVLLSEPRRGLGRRAADGLVALAGQVVEVRVGAGPRDLELGERVAEHLALAAPLPERLLAALELVADVADFVLDPRHLGPHAVARGQGLGQELLALDDLLRELLAARGHLPAPGERGLDAGQELLVVLREPAALRLDGRRPLAQRGQPAP